jgi:hypothetical protein
MLDVIVVGRGSGAPAERASPAAGGCCRKLLAHPGVAAELFDSDALLADEELLNGE